MHRDSVSVLPEGVLLVGLEADPVAHRHASQPGASHFFMFSTLSAPPLQKNSRTTRKDQKTGTPSEFSIGRGRIGPGAASKM